jgi:hypothetical protein
LYLDVDGINELVKSYENNTKAIKEELLKLCWYMRGGLDYNLAHMLSIEDREIIGKIVTEHLEVTKESGLPFF